jgi:hypothetical protein
MVGIATAGSTLGNLVLLPACLTLGRRWRGTPRRLQGTLRRVRRQDAKPARTGISIAQT